MGLLPRIDDLRISGVLPSPKGVALAIMELCQRENATLDEVSRVVMTDPALSGRLLRQANAAVSGPRPVVSLAEAVRRLGLGLVKQLALGFSLVDQYGEGGCAGFDYQGFWSRSLLMGLTMQSLARANRMGPPDDLFACGLLARVGRLALATAYPEPYGQILSEAGNGEPKALLAAENERLQIDHNRLGAALLGDWGFPLVLVEPVLYHEDVSEQPFEAGTRGYVICQSLYLAACVAELGVAGESDRHKLVSELACIAGRVGIDQEELGRMIDLLIAEWSDWGEILRVPTATLPPFASIANAPAPRPEAAQRTEPLRVLMVDDELSSRRLMRKLLTDHCGHETHLAADGKTALAMALELRPQVVITDWMMPEMDGLQLTRALRATEWGRATYVVMLTGLDAEERIEEAFAEGVDDYLTKPVSVRALRARLFAAWRYVRLQQDWEHDRVQLKRIASELAVSNRKLERAALTDALTGLPNRRAGVAMLSQAWSASRRGDHPLTVMVIDVDRFKQINDEHGHSGGDVALAEVAKTLRAVARKDDWICRMGGEEFLVICPNTALEAAARAAERLRRAIGDAPVSIGHGVVQITVSIGLAAREAGTADADALVVDADKALYAAKNAGRNRCCVMHGGKIHLGPA